MNKSKLLKNVWLIALILFQVLPIGTIVFHLYSSASNSSESGWIVNEAESCKFFTSSNAGNRQFSWSGECVNGLIHGNGILTTTEYGFPLYRYSGHVSDGKLNGEGHLIFLSDGDTHEGTFKDNRLNGFGKYYNDDGDHFQGYFENGVSNGYGTYWYPPESEKFKYAGEWKAGKEEGKGTLYYRSGKVLEGHFENGSWIKPLEADQPTNNFIPKNILITNDDGIEDMDRLMCLAEALSESNDKVVIAVSNQNKSGTSNMMSLTSKGYLDVKTLSVDTVKQIYVYEVQGYPADCVLLGAMGIFPSLNANIDLVISGINGGANEGASWFGSGTIGAARTAAIAGIPAIAVSGIDEDNYNKDNLNLLCTWVSKLIKSPIVANIKPKEYLAVSIPNRVESIKGIKIIPRAITFDKSPFLLKMSESKDVENMDRWLLLPSGKENPYDMPAENDVFYFYNNYITITPMTIDENNKSAFSSYQSFESTVPGIK